MRKLKLLIAACALLLGAGGVHAQWTDYTSSITNPSFESDGAIADLTSCGWATDRATGWTIKPGSASNSQDGVGNSSSKLQGIGASHEASDGENFFYMRENWNPNTTFSISQTVENLPAGVYLLSVKAAFFSSVASAYTLTLSESDGKSSSNTLSISTGGENWRKWCVLLEKKSDESSLTITAAYKTPAENSGGKHYAMIIDDVRLAKADLPVTPIENGTSDIYLVNKQTNQFISAGATWGTHAILDQVGHEMTATLNDGFYTLKTQQFNNKYFNDLYMDSGEGKWLFLETSQGSGKYYLTQDGTNYLTSSGAGAELINVTEPTDASVWTITTKADRISALESATNANPTDATFLIKNQNFSRNNTSGWTVTSGGGNAGYSGENPNFNWQQWNSTFNIKQELSGLPVGKYSLKAQGFYRPGANNTESDAQNSFLYAGEQLTTPIQLVASDGADAADGTKGLTTANTNSGTSKYVPNSQSDASKAFTAGLYDNNVINNIVVSDGTLTVGAKCETNVNNAWTVIDNFRLYYYGRTLSNDAEALPTGALAAGKWYYYDVAVAGDYRLNTTSNVVYTTDGSILTEEASTINTAFANTVVALEVGRYYIKSSTAQTFTIKPNVMEYTVGTATSSILENSYVQSLSTVTLTYANAATNDDEASLSLGNGTVKLLDSNAAEIATAELTIEGNVVTATFSNVTLNMNSTYSLAIAANVIGYVAGSTYNEAQNISFKTPLISDGIYYVKTSDNKYLSRGGNYNTQAIVDNYGIPVKVETDNNGTTGFIFIDNWMHLFDAGNQSIYTDNNNNIKFVLESTEGGCYIVNKNDNGSLDYKLYINAEDGNRVVSSNENATVWIFESTATEAHKTQMQALKDAQAAAAATAASIENVSTQAEMKSYLGENYYNISIDINGTGGVTKESYQQGGSSAQAATPLEIFKETVSGLKPGLYRLSVKAFERITWAEDVYNAGGAPGLTYVYANNEKIQLASLFDYPADAKWKDTDLQFGGKYYVDRTDAAQAAFDAGNYENVVYVNVTADEGQETGSITFGINKPHRYANDGNRGAWICYNNFALDLMQDKNSKATEDDYAALNTAIKAAEANKLGFGINEFAPYNNIAAQEALAAAKAVNQEIENIKDDVNALTSALTSATWTANTEDVDAIFNGDMAIPNGYNPKGWTRSNNAWGQQVDKEGASSGKAWYYNSDGAWQYGNDGYYTMPLADETYYDLTFKYSSHENNNPNKDLKVSVLNGEDGLAATSMGANKSTTLVKKSVRFKTGAAGNYLLSLENNGNTHLTDVTLLKTTLQTVKDELAAVKSEATALLDNAEYANVAGSEKTELNTAAATTPEETIDAYLALIDEIKAKMTVFTAAKASYDNFVAEKANAKRIAASITENVSDPTTAAEAVAALQTILVGEYNYVKENYNSNAAETYGMTIDKWIGTATSGGNEDTPQTNSNQKWGNTATTYYEQGKNGWGSSAWTLNYSITKTLPAGEYVLKIAARASEGTTAQLKATVGEETITENLPNVSATGKGITTSGVASFDEGEFANNNNGYGWQWRYLIVKLDEEKEVTFQIDASANSYNQWCSFGDVAIISTVNVSELTAAYNNFEMKTLGFQKNEYAPYQNAELLSAYSQAKAIVEGEAEPDTQEGVNALTATLKAAAWTVNTEDVDAIFNGNFAEELKGWKRTNNWGQMQTGLEGDYATAYYNQPGSLVYGETGVYTMPLAGNTAYKLTFAYRSHEDGSNINMTVSVLNGEDGLAATRLEGNASKTEWKTGVKVFKTGAAGNYVLTLANNGNTWMTGVSIVKAEIENITIAENADYTPAEAYANVTFKRTVVEGWNGMVLPFDATVDEVKSAFGATAVKDFAGIAYDEAKGVTLKFQDATEVKAGRPFMMKAAAGASYTFKGVVLPATGLQNIEMVDETNSNVKYTMKGTYAATTNLNDVNFALINGTKFFYHTAGVNESSAKAFRAYFENNSTEPASARVSFDFGDDETTGIEEIRQNAAANGQYYDLQGRKVQNLNKKGVYLLNGKKVTVK